MGTLPPGDEPTPARSLQAPPPSEPGDPIDWPERSHWSEFDLAIEAARRGSEPPEAEPTAEDDA